MIRPIAPSVTSPTTRRPGRISATMVCGILAHKQKGAAQAALFYARHFPWSTSDTEWVESSKLHILRAAFLLAASASGLKRAEMNLCVPKTLSVLVTPRNHLSWWNDRAPVFRRGGVGLTIQVE